MCKVLLQQVHYPFSFCPTVSVHAPLNRWNCGRNMAIFRYFKMAAAAMLDFWNYKVLTVGRIISAELRHHAKFCGDWPNRCHDISSWWQLQSWILKILFLTIQTVKKDELRHCAKFCRNRSNRGWDMAIFRFFKMAAAAILDSWNFRFLTVEMV